MVAAALAAGSVGFASFDKKVTLVVDGTPRTVSTYAVTVGEVTEEAGVDVGGRDVVEPAASAVARDGGTVTVVHARPITLEVDGKDRTVWVAALTVDEAMVQLGYSPQSTWTAASRSTRLDPGARLVVSTPKTFRVTADGTTRTVTSSAPTVGLAVADTVGLSPQDRLSVARGTAVTEGLQVRVTRVAVTYAQQKRTLPFPTTQQPDPATYVGIDTPVSAGSPGTAVVTVQTTKVDGVPQGTKDVKTVVTAKPVPAVVRVGAKPFPADVDALNWAALGKCESTNNPKAMNPSGKYTGEYQFSDATWQSVGGTGRSMDAPAAEQLARAKMLYMRSGAGQWECGSHLFD